MRMRVLSLASLSGLRIYCCCELWCRSQTQLGSHIAVAVAVAQASSYSSNSTLAWELAYARGVSLKSKRNKQTKDL